MVELLTAGQLVRSLLEESVLGDGVRGDRWSGLPTGLAVHGRAGLAGMQVREWDADYSRCRLCVSVANLLESC